MVYLFLLLYIRLVFADEMGTYYLPFKRKDEMGTLALISFMRVSVALLLKLTTSKNGRCFVFSLCCFLLNLIN